MREILFKAKRIDNGEWVEGYVVDDFLALTDRMYIVEKGKTTYQINAKTLSQYTGLKDKNGKMIFENDILDYWEIGIENIKQRLKVFFENGQFVVAHYAINLLNSRNMSSEIIGNIFDNKNLIGE
ncbi:MAG: YopX family protein [Clostridia bacterium]|nr:YopX family protein [Clostridia bacterium]